MRYFLTIIALMMSFQVTAAGFHYCSGKITQIVTRASSEGTQVAIQGMKGMARVNFGGDIYSEMHRRQISMLLSAYMADKPVLLEFVDSTLNCADNHDGIPIRFVKLN